MTKIGHRRVTEGGSVTYKKTPTSDIQRAIQLGIQHSIGTLQQKPIRDVLFRDFEVVETVDFPRAGTKTTPAHSLVDFRFRTFAPVAFRSFRNSFNLDVRDYLSSICNNELHELANPGASGSIFYTSSDDEFIIKTVQHKEAEFLQKLLPEYYMNLVQHTRTLLPKFYGLYCYQSAGKNIRFIVMNNILPSSIKIHQKYDLKGSSYKRKASELELAKSYPTLKDLDFKERHPEGIFLVSEAYDELVNTIERDCLVLESFRIMDYSLLLGIHNLDEAERENLADKELSSKSWERKISGDNENPVRHHSTCSIGRDVHRLTPISEDFNYSKSLSPHTTLLSHQQENVFGPVSPSSCLDRSLRGHHSFSGVLPSKVLPNTKSHALRHALPARSSTGDRLFIFIGIIDILQSYRILKKIEHSLKSLVTDADTVSVTNPAFYARRFQSTLGRFVFRKMQSWPSQNSLPPPSRTFQTRSLGSSLPLLQCSSLGNLRAQTTISLPARHNRPYSPPIFFGSSSQLSWCAQSILSLNLDSDAATVSELTSSSESELEDAVDSGPGHTTPTDSPMTKDMSFFREEGGEPLLTDDKDSTALDTILLAIQKVVRKQQRSACRSGDICVPQILNSSKIALSYNNVPQYLLDQGAVSSLWGPSSSSNSVKLFMQAAESDFN